jgi:hypothetical protein
MKAYLIKIYGIIKPYLIHYGIFAVILIALILGYRYYWYRTKTVIIPVYKTLTKVLPVVKTKIKYKTAVVSHIQYIPEKEYLTITKTKTIPQALKLKKILAVGNVPAYKGITQVVCAFNNKTSKADLLFKQLPYQSKPKKFFSSTQVPYVEGGIGLLTNKYGSIRSGTLGIGDRFTRVGNIRFNIKDNLYLNSRDTINFVGAFAKYKF